MNQRNLSDVIQEDKSLRRFIELNIDILTIWAKVGNIDIEHLTIRDSKVQMEGKSVCLTIKPR